MFCEDRLALVQALALLIASRFAHLPPNWSLFVSTSSRSSLPAELLPSRLSSPHRAGEKCGAGAGRSAQPTLQDLAQRTCVMMLGKYKANNAVGIA